MSTSSLRIECPKCKALCLVKEKNCWQCHSPLHAKPEEADTAKKGFNDVEIKPGLIRFGDDPEPEPEPVCEAPPPTPAPGKRFRVTMTGETIEEDIPGSELHPSHIVETIVAGKIGDTEIVAELGAEVMVLSFCKHCGHSNPEGLRDCEKCGRKLDVVAAGSVGDIEPLPRAWSYDVLGLCWIILGFSAVYAGQFLLTPSKSNKVSISDYLWTGFVVLAPGVLIFMRHYFVKPMFWVMTLGSAMVWSVIGFLWWMGKLYVSDNMQVTLTWLALLSGLSLVSWFIVRTNDAFDMSM